jgi:DNA-binding transcriptional MerR regulator
VKRTEYRIDELARAGKTTVRNVRAYQERGLLPPPRRQGRVGLYSAAHLARLRTIGALLERGYSLANIGELLGAWEQGTELGDVLGVEEAITSPFLDEKREPISVKELAAMFGTTDPALLKDALAIGLLEMEGTALFVPSVRLLRAGAELYQAGIPLGELVRELAALHQAMDLVAARFVRVTAAHVVEPLKTTDPKQLARTVERIRPLAQVVVEVELARALEKHVRAMLGERLVEYLARARTKGRR